MAEEQDQGLASAQQGGFNYQEMDLEDVSECRSTTAGRSSNSAFRQGRLHAAPAIVAEYALRMRARSGG
jgi:hypothetical protein